jgi:hypothetical protein
MIMKILKEINLLVVCALFALNTTAQGPPPPPDRATAENKPYIDTLAIVCNYTDVFNILKDSMIYEFAAENKWNNDKIEKAKDHIQCGNVKYMYYNAHAHKSQEELVRLIAHYRNLSEKELKKEYKNYSAILLHNFENTIEHGCIYIDGLEE